jgi:hypothetical protein
VDDYMTRHSFSATAGHTIIRPSSCGILKYIFPVLGKNIQVKYCKRFEDICKARI